MIWLRGDLKRIVYVEVLGKHDKVLLFRSLQSAWSNMIKTASTKYISLMTIGIIAGFGPPITVAMSSCFLGETFRAYEGFLMFLQMLCGMVVLFGAANAGGFSFGNTGNLRMEQIMVGLQFFNAVTSAGGNIAMRKMKKFHESVITWYANWSIMLSSMAIMALNGKGIGIFYTFGAYSWLLLLINGFTATTFQMARFKAY
jgi:drug/metabolite transporter (DMT)-like permease